MSLKEELGAALLESGSEAIIAADAQGVISLWNPGAERIFGYCASEAVGRALDLIIPGSLRQRHRQGYEQVMRTGQTRYGQGDLLAVPGPRKDGKRISLEFTIVPLRGPGGEMKAVGAVLRDVTARFEELRELRKNVKRT